MKQFILLAIIISPFICFSQEQITFSKVIKVDSVKKDELYVRISQWFAITYNSAQDVIQMEDKETGIIIGKGAREYSFGKTTYGCYVGYVNYTIKVQARDNRFKVDLSGFTHEVNGIYKSCELGLITSSELYTTKGMSKRYHNNVWNDLKIKIEDYSNSIFERLSEATSKETKEDW